MTVITRKARFGTWTVWRLLVAARLVGSIETAKRICRAGEIQMNPGKPWSMTFDEASYVTVGMFTPVVLTIRGRRVEIFGIEDDEADRLKLPHIDTSGMNEPPIPGARLVVQCRSSKTKASRVEMVSQKVPFAPRCGDATELDAPF